MKKILFFIESLSGGGAEKVLTTLVKNLNKSKFEITVLLVVNTGVYIEEIKNYCKIQYMLPDCNTLTNVLAKAKYHFEYKWIYGQSLEKVYRKYVTEEYDIEVAFVEGFATKFIASSNNPKSKKVCWLHIDMDKNPYADSYYSSIEEERCIYSKYNKIIGVSESVKKIFEKKFSLPNSVQVIYNPVDSEEILGKAKNESPYLKNEMTLISVGRLEQQKGYDRLISALARLSENDFKYQLWILGEGSERANLEELIRNYQLENRIHLKGFQKNPFKWMKYADAFVCSSRAEGYSLVIAEAMILGIPIFSVDCAGPNELLEYGKYGVLVENTDAALEKMLLNLLNGKYNLKYYRELAMQRNKFFELAEIIKEVERIFLNL